jgi:hypothetical protein
MSMDSGSLVAWLTLLLLAVNAVFFWIYLQETKKIRIANEAQLEAQIRPALDVDPSKPSDLNIVNVGKGPALSIGFSLRDSGADVDWSAAPEGPQYCRGPLAPDQCASTWLNSGGELTLFSKSIQVRYQSLSGKQYATMVDFNQFAVFQSTRLFAR